MTIEKLIESMTVEAMLASKCAALVTVVATIGVTSCGGAAPTSPGGTVTTGGSDVLAVEVSCPTSLLIGQKGPCVAVARLRSGQTPVVSFEATWSSNHPEIVAVDGLGTVSGRSAGQATVSASYRDRKAEVTLVVTAEDALRIDSGQAHQGDFTPGSTVTMWLQGYYSVASAETGRLSLRILSDQTRTIAATPPVTVAKGGDSFLLSSTFVVPGDSVEVCRTAILEVGSVTIAEPNSKSFPLWCIPIRRTLQVQEP
jgi:Big-like domain-containing protein